MFKKIVFFLLFCCVTAIVDAQINASAKAPNSYEQGRLRISLITCGPGDDIWEVFGHSCIRVIDSARSDSFRDVVFNYGTFDYNHANFIVELLKGTLPYSLGVVPFSQFRKIFEDRRRSMCEDLFLLDVKQEKALVAFLANNALPQNREYKYDFLTNNCSTCIRDALGKVYGGKVVFGNALQGGYIPTFRGISEEYAYRQPFERLGLYTFIGSASDRPIDNMESLFIPDYLRRSVENATIDGKKMTAPPVQLLAGAERGIDRVNWPFVCCTIIAIITIAGISVKKWGRVGKVMSTVLLLATGFAGCMVLFFWFGTDHLCTKVNYNFLWAFPANIAAPFLKGKWKRNYSLVAMLLICAAIMLHLLRIQFVPLFELLPILLALLYIHGRNYRAAN